MITQITLHNIKCFADLSLNTSPLTLLSGLNGMGKSTVLQSLLLLRQSHVGGTLSQRLLRLNGELVSIGTSRDLYYEGGTDEAMGIGLSLTSDEGLDITSTVDCTMRYQPFEIEVGAETVSQDPEAAWVDYTGLFSERDFVYLHAERSGPRIMFPIGEISKVRMTLLGPRGEFTSDFLSNEGRRPLEIKSLAYDDSVPDSLNSNLEAWMSEISPGVRINLEAHRSMDVVNLEYSFSAGSQLSNSYRSTNVGFGITYSLPVLVAILSSKPGSLVLLENPEAHLHPRGQVRIGELIALAAAAGVQMFVETHSDHVLNGIRLAVHRGKIDPKSVALIYFDRAFVGGEVRPKVVCPKIDRNGRLDIWPEGFFDEFDNSLDVLLAPAGAD